MIKPFYKNLKVGDKVQLKGTKDIGEVKQLLPNPYLQLFWLYPNYLVNFTNMGDIYTRSELRLLK